MSVLKPKFILKNISRQWPQAWQQVKKFRSVKGKEVPDWPDWCYVPLSAGYAIYTQGGNYDSPIIDLKFSPAVITAAAAWRVSQGIYHFDADLYNSLIAQPLDDKLPCDALKRLPEWCVYIETYGARYCGMPFSGFWAHLEKDMNDNREELRLVLMMDDGDNIPVAIHIGDWTLEEGLQRMQAETEKNAKKYIPEVEFPKVNYFDDIAPLVQLVLYLCADNIDMSKVPVHPNARVRMSGQVDVPREARTWNVGERIGAAIRKYQNENVQSEREYVPDSLHARPRPHVRRAHWHHYWTGSRKSKQKLILKWLPPIPVGVDEEDEDKTPAVIHQVHKEK